MDFGTCKNNIIDIIRDISDRDKQEKSWPIGKDDISSIVEMYELFDDFRLRIFLTHPWTLSGTGCDLLRGGFWIH